MKKKICLILLVIPLVLMVSSCQLLEMFIPKYRVSYYSDGSLVKQETVKEKSLLKEPILAEKEGYKFLGWYKNLEDTNSKWDFNKDTVKGHLRLDALWELDIKYLSVENVRVDNNLLSWDMIEEATYKVNILGEELTLTENELNLETYKDRLKNAETVKIEPLKEGFTGVVSEGKVKHNAPEVIEIYSVEFDEFDFSEFELNRSTYKTVEINYEDHYFYVKEARLTKTTEEPKIGTVALILREEGLLELKEGYENFAGLIFNLGNFQNRSSTSRLNVYTSNIPLEGWHLVNSYNHEGEGFTTIEVKVEDISELVNVNEKVYFKLEADISGADAKTIVLDDLKVKQTTPAYYQLTLKGQIGALDAYYKSAESLEGKSLVEELRIIISTNLNGIRYADYKEIGEFADKKVDDETLVRGIYDNRDLKAPWGSKSEWHREHVWPNSRLGMGRVKETEVNQGSDPHNLRAIYPSTNSTRSNRYYDNADAGVTDWMALSDGRFYPSDLDKGDVARILMYMVVRYEFLGLTDHVPLLSRAAYTVEAAYMGKLSLLLSWHQADPVDQFEKNRNEIIFGYQNNRNPFIDHPELFEEVYNYFMSIDAERNVTTMIYIKYEVNYSELTRDRKELYA